MPHAPIALAWTDLAEIFGPNVLYLSSYFYLGCRGQDPCWFVFCI